MNFQFAGHLLSYNKAYQFKGKAHFLNSDEKKQTKKTQSWVAVYAWNCTLTHDLLREQDSLLYPLDTTEKTMQIKESELKTEEGHSADIYPWRYMSAQCPHYVRTTSQEG